MGRSFPSGDEIIPISPRHIRWIDFDNGSDDNDGLTRKTPWKSIHGGNSNYWVGFPIVLEDYFHGGQIGPGYEYRIRGTYNNKVAFLNTQEGHGFPLLKGVPGNPIIFTSWNVINDRAVIETGETWGIETASNYTDSQYDDHHVVFRGIDFHIDASVLYGNYVTFIDCTFIPATEFNTGWQLLNYGDWLRVDGCILRGFNSECMLLYGNYITIQNSIIRGLNRNGGEIDRDSEDGMENSGYSQPWLIYLQDPASPYDERDALRIINNVILGWGGIESDITGFYIYLDSPFGNAHGVVIRNNIFADLGSGPLGLEFGNDDDRGIFAIDHELVPITIDNNLFADDIFNLPNPDSFYRNNNSWDEVIDFTPDSDIFDDPKFRDQIARDFRLQSTSSAIRAGSPNKAPRHDKRGKRRGIHPSIGAYEYGPF